MNKLPRRSLTIALDSRYDDENTSIIAKTADHPVVKAYKISAAWTMAEGLIECVRTVKESSDCIAILDMQKAGTDVPDTADAFFEVCAEAEVDMAILFPLSGPETLYAWVQSAFVHKIIPIVGAYMTHPKFIQSEGGYIDDQAPFDAYSLAASLQVTDFVVPGNKPEVAKRCIHAIEAGSNRLMQDTVAGDITLFSPGLVTQGGSISESSAAIGDYPWSAIMGRAIAKAVLDRTITAYLDKIEQELGVVGGGKD